MTDSQLKRNFNNKTILNIYLRFFVHLKNNNQIKKNTIKATIY